MAKIRKVRDLHEFDKDDIKFVAAIEDDFIGDYDEPDDPDAWKEGKDQEHIDDIERAVGRQLQQRRRFNLKNAYRAQREKLNMNSLVNKSKKPIYHVDALSLARLFKGNRLEITCSFRNQRIQMGFDDILIAYNGRYRTLIEFAEIYDDEDGDYPILNAISDAAIEAYNKMSPRKNKTTNKDRYLTSMSNAETPTDAKA